MKSILFSFGMLVAFMAASGFERAARAGHCSDMTKTVQNDDGTTTVSYPWVFFGEKCRRFGFLNSNFSSAKELNGACKALGMRKYVGSALEKNLGFQHAVIFKRNGSIDGAYISEFFIAELICK